MYRIFIIEDDEIIANLLKKNLCSWGYDVSCAQDFSNIIQEFARLDPQLVLLDLKLPFYNGFHWCEEIRRISQVPIIFISSAADNMNMVMAMSRGADDFIAKPFDMDVLTAKIQATGHSPPHLFLRDSRKCTGIQRCSPQSAPLYPDLERPRYRPYQK